MTLTNFPNGVSSFGIPVLGGSGIPFTGNYYFVNPLTGSDGDDGGADTPLKTITAAYDRCVSGNNDVVYVEGNGLSTGTARLSATLTWAKNATHLIGITAPTMVAQRARIAATSGVNFTPLINVTGAGCMISNLSIFHGYDSAVAQVAFVAGGERNYYGNVNFGGMGHATAAAQTGSRSIVIGEAASGKGENTFENCVFGLDTVTRSAANYTMEIIGGAPRNIFRDCYFPSYISSAAAAYLLVGASGIDRFTVFERCSFLNAVKSGGTTMTQAAVLNAAAGGLMLMKDSTLVGVTDWETTPTNQIYLDGGPPVAATSGLAVNNT